MWVEHSIMIYEVVERMRMEAKRLWHAFAQVPQDRDKPAHRHMCQGTKSAKHATACATRANSRVVQGLKCPRLMSCGTGVYPPSSEWISFGCTVEGTTAGITAVPIHV